MDINSYFFQEKKRQFISGKFQQCLHESPERGTQHELSAVQQWAKLQVDQRLIGLLASKWLRELPAAIKIHRSPMVLKKRLLLGSTTSCQANKCEMMKTSLWFAVSLLKLTEFHKSFRMWWVTIFWQKKLVWLENIQPVLFLGWLEIPLY